MNKKVDGINRIDIEKIAKSREIVLDSIEEELKKKLSQKKKSSIFKKVDGIFYREKEDTSNQNPATETTPEEPVNPPEPIEEKIAIRKAVPVKKIEPVVPIISEPEIKVDKTKQKIWQEEMGEDVEEKTEAKRKEASTPIFAKFSQIIKSRTETFRKNLEKNRQEKQQKTAEEKLKIEEEKKRIAYEKEKQKEEQEEKKKTLTAEKEAAKQKIQEEKEKTIVEKKKAAEEARQKQIEEKQNLILEKEKALAAKKQEALEKKAKEEETKKLAAEEKAKQIAAARQAAEEARRKKAEELEAQKEAAKQQKIKEELERTKAREQIIKQKELERIKHEEEKVRLQKELLLKKEELRKEKIRLEKEKIAEKKKLAAELAKKEQARQAAKIKEAELREEKRKKMIEETKQKRIALQNKKAEQRLARQEKRKKQFQSFLQNLKVLKEKSKIAVYIGFQKTIAGIILTIFVFIGLYLIQIFLVTKLGLDNFVTRKTAKIFPVPALYTDAGFIEYYDYQDQKLNRYLHGKISQNELDKNLKIDFAKEIIISQLARKYGIKETDPTLRWLDILEKAANDPEINQVPMNRISRVAELLKKGDDFLEAEKYGDTQGFITIKTDNLHLYNFANGISQLKIQEISDIVSTPEGYYIFKKISQTGDQENYAYLFIQANDINSYIDKKVSQLKMWSLVD